MKVTDEKTLQATTLVLGSDLDAIVKTSRDQVLVFAQDMKTGQGRAGARVLVADGEVVLDAKTGETASCCETGTPPRDRQRPLELPRARRRRRRRLGPRRARQGRPGLDRLAPTSTPTARPTGPARRSSCAAWSARSSTASTPTSPARSTASRSTTAAAGSSSPGRSSSRSSARSTRRSPLDERAPVGSYRVRLCQPGKSEFAGSFEVQSYQLEKIDLAFDLTQTVYYRGETVKADLVARYQYGHPLANRPIAVALPDGRTLQGTTDAAGKYHVEFATEGFAEEQALRLVAQLPQDNVAAAAAVMLAVRASAST